MSFPPSTYISKSFSRTQEWKKTLPDSLIRSCNPFATTSSFALRGCRLRFVDGTQFSYTHFDEKNTSKHHEMNDLICHGILSFYISFSCNMCVLFWNLLSCYFSHSFLFSTFLHLFPLQELLSRLQPSTYNFFTNSKLKIVRREKNEKNRNGI